MKVLHYEREETELIILQHSGARLLFFQGRQDLQDAVPMPPLTAIESGCQKGNYFLKVDQGPSDLLLSGSDGWAIAVVPTKTAHLTSRFAHPSPRRRTDRFRTCRITFLSPAVIFFSVTV